MNSALSIFCYFSCLMSLLCTLIIIIQNKFHIYYKILALLCLISCNTVIGFWPFYEGILPLHKHAYLWVISFPFDFAPGTMLYLYIKSILKKNKKIKKWDFLHFLPTILHFIELIPFHFLPVKQKQIALTSYLSSPGGLMPNSVFLFPLNVHVFLKTTLWIFYISLTIIVLFRFYKRNHLWISRNEHIWFWLTSLTTIHIISLIICLFNLIFLDNFPYGKFSVIHPVFCMLSCIILLMFKPKILYGLRHFQNVNNISKEEEKTFSKKFELPHRLIQEYKEKIDLLIHNEKIFLKKQYSLKDMSIDLNIPLHHLSFVINNEYNTNYNSLINNSRINYVIEHRYDLEWSQFSIEGIGYEVGFSSRSTFFKAFKIVTNETPSEFFRKRENNYST